MHAQSVRRLHSTYCRILQVTHFRLDFTSLSKSSSSEISTTSVICFFLVAEVHALPSDGLYLVPTKDLP